MSEKKPSYEALQARLEQAEATLVALRRGEVDSLMGEAGPLLVQYKAVVDELARLRAEAERLAGQWQATFDATSDAILILDKGQRIVRANRAAEAVFNCPMTEMIGKGCCEIVHKTTAPAPECPFHPMRQSLQRQSLEMQLGEHWYLVTVDPLLDTDGNLTGAVYITRDITAHKQAEAALHTALEQANASRRAMLNVLEDQKRAEAALQAFLQHKTQLIQELYHRTKNNMQVVMSMLMLQAGFTDDKKVRGILQESASRIQSMALVHEKLYQSQDLSSINLAEYVADLAQLLSQTYQVTSDRITVVAEVEPVQALIDIAVPCGLILNELLANALEHAFPNGRAGEIRIRLRRLGPGELLLEVADNGVGLPAGFDLRQAGTFGLQIILAIAEHQLQGTVAFESKAGVTWRIRFRDDLYRERV